jgi:lipoprotein-anchoring transpeptidase ErfK/SrfK
VRQLENGYLWVSVQSQTEFNGEAWYEINANEFVRSDTIAVTAPSSFQGVVVTAQPNAPFAFVLTWLQPLLEPGGAANAGAPALGRYNLVTIYEQRSYGGLLWYRIGEGQWIPQTAVGVINVDLPPEGVAPGERWIEVDLFEQTLAAYEGERLVYATLVSSGLKQWATDPGLFRIWVKLVKAKMSGREGFADYYYIEDVPWIMYFNRDMALHGAYWHDRFGYPHSHGCVNLAPLDAQWLFNWTGPVVPEGEKAMYPTEADPGTWVWVHE